MNGVLTPFITKTGKNWCRRAMNGAGRQTIIKSMANNSFDAAAKLRVGDAQLDYFRLARLEEQGLGTMSRLPFSTRILLENLVRNEDGKRVAAADIQLVARGEGAGVKEISFMPARVLLQDFTGVPCVVDLAAMRDALAAMGSDPRSEEHTSELQSHSFISYAVFCLKK